MRCAASTGLNLYDAVIAGLAALKGPKHGGAGVLASQLVKTLVDKDVAPVVRERVALGERFAGFGHGVYKRGDPRAMSLLEALTRAGAPRKFTREIPERIAEATGEFVNIDYALAVLVQALRMPAGSELALFAMARTVGWIAHASEQLQHGKLIRPRARYVGPAPGRSCDRPVECAKPMLTDFLRSGSGCALPPRLRRRRSSTAESATINAPPNTASIHRCLPLCSMMRQAGILMQR